MGETKIIRNDRGLDFKRIEQFIKIFQQKCQKKSSEFSKQVSATEKEREQKAFKHFGLDADLEAIKSINNQIEELEKKRKCHEEKIRDFTQGTNSSQRYNTYSTIRDGSPISEYIKEGGNKYETLRNKVWALHESLSQELWFATDLEQAIEVMQRFQKELDGISLEGGGTDAERR